MKTNHIEMNDNQNYIKLLTAALEYRGQCCNAFKIVREKSLSAYISLFSQTIDEVVQNKEVLRHRKIKTFMPYVSLCRKLLEDELA